MSNPLDILSRSGLKAGVSAVALVGIDKQNGYIMDGKRAMYQGAGSLLSNTLEGFVRPMLPVGAQISSMWLQPVLVGGSFTFACKVLLKDKSYKYNFLASVGAELAANWTAPMLSALMNPSGSVIGAIAGPAPAVPSPYSAVW